jgi:recombinational DNA repair ATPase RecF
MKILSLEAQNILRLKAVHIVPHGPLVVIGGENKQGKTSILESIRMACGGARAMPAEPVRRGAKEGIVRLDMGDLVVEFTVDKSGGSVVVRDADG